MKSIAELKPCLRRIVAEMEKTYADALLHKGGNVTFRALPPSDVAPYLDLTAYNFDDDIDRYVDDLLLGHERMAEARKDIDDNYIPQLNINLGIADYSAFVAGDISFQKDTSWARPALASLDAWRDLPPLGTAKWHRKYMEILERVLERTEDTGIPFARGFYSPMDLAAALLGPEIFTAFYDEPGKLHDFLDFCADATVRFASGIYAAIRRHRRDAVYGTLFIDGVVNMSEDISSMLSPALYKEFCAPHTQKVIDAFGAGHMHCHSCAMYLVGQICALDRVANLWVATDPNKARPFDHLQEMIEDANGTCLAIDCDSFDEIEQNIDLLRKGNFSVCLPVKTMEEARRTAQRFRSL